MKLELPENFFKLERIPPDKLKSSWLYWVKARNFKLAVFDGDKGYVGIRHKFGKVYLSTEYDWDLEGAPYGTVNPVEAICKAPFQIIRNDTPGLFDWLEYVLETDKIED